MVKIEKSLAASSGGVSKTHKSLAPSKCGSTQNVAANIKVIVRVRPLNEREVEQNHRVVIDVVDDQMLVFDPKEEMRPFFYQGVQQPNKNYLKRANKELKFVFDNVCRQNTTNMDVFEITTKDVLESLMEGYNCSVFAYGATGAGKTFTMIGSKEHPGITYLTMDHLFNRIASLANEREFDIGVSYIEVYNENVYDLLKPSPTPLQLREDSKYGVMVAGLTLNNIKTARELLNMLEDGNKNRTQHPTDANAESSRSHAVFQVYVKMRYKTSSQLRLVKLSMIDLAGSERASATGCSGDRFKEGANINKSLLSLGNCINKLADGSNYIPYRDSKLTRLLKDSLGGNCRTVMIANVSPSSVCYEDTYNTLKYAARANKIKLTIKKNIVDGQMRVSQYVKIAEELKKKVKELEAKLSLSQVKQVKCEVDVNKEKGRASWRSRLAAEGAARGALQQRLLALMAGRRVRALRRRLRARALALSARGSSDLEPQMCSEDIPRQERAMNSHRKQSVNLDTKIMMTYAKWNESHKKLNALYNEAVTEYPELTDFIERMQLQSELQHTKARDNLRLKLLTILNKECKTSMECMTKNSSMVKKLYLTLKGYDKAPPALTAEYLELMKHVKSAKGITWSDEDTETDPHFKFISTLELDNPTAYFDSELDSNDYMPTDIPTDSDDFDLENVDPECTSAKKRKGTPIKLMNNETIIINDSFESLDAQRLSAKKVKQENCDTGTKICESIDPKDLDSTFVLAGKEEPWKKYSAKVEKAETPSVKKVLGDRTNVGIQRTVTFADNKARVVKPVVGRAMPLRRAPAFGSGLARDGAPLARPDGFRRVGQTEKSVGFKAVRGRERMQTHPYSRPTAGNGRK